MPKPFDATIKQLLLTYPDHWCRYLGLNLNGPVSVLNAELSTVTAEADSALLVEGPAPWLVQAEFQSSRDLTLARRLQRYNVLLSYRQGLPVQSAVILLRPEADAPGLTGVLEERLPDGRLIHLFHYLVVRVWEKPVEEVLQADVAILPMAPLANVRPDQLPGVIARMSQRLDREVSREESATLWTATYLLMGLRYPATLTERVLQGVRNMKDSVTYQAILAEGEAKGEARGKVEGEARGKARGKVEEAVRILLRLGRKRFGDPSPEVVAAVKTTTDVDRIEVLTDRVLDVSSWEDLFADDQQDHPR
ncbi:MAG: DUF4351 domain-containing protein [Isosphaeraceae bacterium]